MNALSSLWRSFASYLPMAEHEHSLEGIPLHPGFADVDDRLLADMVREKRMECLVQFGGVEHLAGLLQTDLKNGIMDNLTDIDHRKKIYGTNVLSGPPAKGFHLFLLEAFKDDMVYVNLLMAVLSLIFSIRQHGWKHGWYDSGSILLTLVLGVVMSAVCNLKLHRCYEELSAKRRDIRVEVVRGGRPQTISIFDVVVGDIPYLKRGDRIPADRLFIEGYSLRVDECQSELVLVSDNNNPFLLSGSKVTDGFAYMLVTSVGINTAWDEWISSDMETPLLARIDKLTSDMRKVGLLVAAFVVLVSLILRSTEFHGSKTHFDDVMNEIMKILDVSITIVEVAIPEGLRLAVTLILAYSMKKMMRDNGMIWKPVACEVLGSATTICTDKTGTLTSNKMKVSEVWLGDQTMINCDHLAPNLLQLLKEGIGLNTTGRIYQTQFTWLPEISGSPTEKALLSWAVLDLGMNIDELKQHYDTIHMETFNSEKKRSGIMMRGNRGNRIHTHWKRAAEVILAMCSHYYDQTGDIRITDAEKRVQIEDIIRGMAAKSLRCIAFAQKSCPGDDGHVHEMPEETGLVLLGILGLKNPCRPGIEAAVEFCKNAGVNIKMITGDNVNTARAIAFECGILAPYEELDGEEVVEGCQFRNYSDEERMDKIDKIRVMGGSSPNDKLLMIHYLRRKGVVAAVTDDTTHDAPPLHESEIGLAMGIQGTEVARESSDIVILDGNFTSVVTLLRWGRCAYANIQKLIETQLTLNIAAIGINLVAAVSSGRAPLTNLQLLWVNLIMVAVGALALATEQPTFDRMEMPPASPFEPLITKSMWQNIITQALYQVTVLLILQFKGRSTFDVNEEVTNILIFYVVVFCQVFNDFNARKPEKQNIFEGLANHWMMFIVIVGLTLALQLVLVEFLNMFSNAGRLTWEQWSLCIGIAALSWPIGMLIKCVMVVLDKP